jgi:L-alanine-DL-glutamate epimerase-like enolase superfamily enzyme
MASLNTQRRTFLTYSAAGLATALTGQPAFGQGQAGRPAGPDEPRTKFRIQRAEAIALPIPLKHSFKMAKGTITHSNHVYVRLEDEAGQVGWGETFNVPVIYARDYRNIYDNLTDYLLPAIIGKDPLEIGSLHTILDGALPLCRDGKNGVDAAAYDLAGKQLGVSVSTLLGGARLEEIPMIAPIGIVPPEQAAETASEFVAKGYKYLKLKLGLDWRKDVQRVVAVREAVGPDITLKGDANAVYSRDDALKALRGLRDVGLQHFEQPLSQHDIVGHAALAQRTSIPLCADESLQTLQDAFNILREDAASAMVLKLIKNGGMYRCAEIVSLCRAVGVPCFMSSGTDMSLGVAALMHSYAAIPGIEGALETAEEMSDDVASNPVKWGPVMKVPEGPGLGIDVDEKQIAKYRVKVR